MANDMSKVTHMLVCIMSTSFFVLFGPVCFESFKNKFCLTNWSNLQCQVHESSREFVGERGSFPEQWLVIEPITPRDNWAHMK